jgi:hypothetical protein
VICHKASCNKDKYVLKFVDKKSLEGHLNHQKEQDRIIDCKKVQVINTVLNPKELNKACNCK